MQCTYCVVDSSEDLDLTSQPHFVLGHGFVALAVVAVNYFTSKYKCDYDVKSIIVCLPTTACIAYSS